MIFCCCCCCTTILLLLCWVIEVGCCTAVLLSLLLLPLIPLPATLLLLLLCAYHRSWTVQATAPPCRLRASATCQASHHKPMTPTPDFLLLVLLPLLDAVAPALNRAVAAAVSVAGKCAFSRQREEISHSGLPQRIFVTIFNFQHYHSCVCNFCRINSHNG